MTRNAYRPAKNAALPTANAALLLDEDRPTARSVRLQIEQEESKGGAQYTRDEWTKRFEQLFDGEEA